MGRLILLSEIGMDATWYFSDAWLSSEARKYKFEWPSKDYPAMVTMMQEDIYRHNDRKIKIRKWIETNSPSVVILDTIDLSYKKYYGKSWEWDKQYEVTNAWYRYHFEDSESALVFSLAFSEWIKPITKWHPGKPEDEAYLNLPQELRYLQD